MSVNHEILFRRKSAVVVPTPNLAFYTTANVETATFIAELANLGFRPNSSLISALSHSDMSVAQMKRVLDLARESVKGHKEYKPMYPNFPEQVVNASEVELYINAIVHYFGDVVGVRILPEYSVDERAPRADIDFDSLKVISLATPREFGGIFVSLLGMKSSWSETDQADVTWFIDNDYAIAGSIPNKENLAYLATRVDLDRLVNAASTTTDVLRMIVVASGGDSALNGVGVDKVKIKSMPKRVRRAVVNRLETFPNLEEDMVRNIALWKLVLHSLHVGDYAKSHPRLANAAKVIRNNGKGANTFNSRVEGAIAQGDTKTALRNLSSRPGDFARRLDKVLRDANDPAEVVSAFAKVADKVSTPVLWGLESFYSNRALVSGPSPVISRSFSVKGRRATVQTADSSLKAVPQRQTSRIVESVYEALEKNYAGRQDLSGSVYVDPSVAGYAIPFGSRSAAKSDVTVGRGSRVKVSGDSDTMRMFIWWKDIENDGWGGRVDLDLSALAISADFTKTHQIGYYNLRGSGITHSGDITSAPDGASEFIDVEVDRTLKAGWRYVAMTVNSYTGQPFSNIPEVYAGAMERNGAQRGEIYDPATVSTAFDVTTDNRMVLPLIFDLETREVIWADMSVNERELWSGNLASNLGGAVSTVKGLVQKKHSQISDLILLHAGANGANLVTSADDASHVFTVQRGRLLHNGEVISHDELLSEWV